MNSASAVTSCQSHLKTVTDTRVLQQSHRVTVIMLQLLQLGIVIMLQQSHPILQESHLVRVTMLQQSL
jgi:hypothetical protein